MSPSASSILSPQSPSFFPSTPHSAACSLRKHPFLLAPRRWGRFARRNDGCFRRLRCMPRRPKKVQHSKQQLEPLCCGPWSPISKEYFQYVEVSSEVERGVVGWEGGGNKGNGFCRWSTPCKLPKNSWKLNTRNPIYETSNRLTLGHVVKWKDTLGRKWGRGLLWAFMSNIKRASMFVLHIFVSQVFF